MKFNNKKIVLRVDFNTKYINIDNFLHKNIRNTIDNIFIFQYQIYTTFK